MSAARQRRLAQHSGVRRGGPCVRGARRRPRLRAARATPGWRTSAPALMRAAARRPATRRPTPWPTAAWCRPAWPRPKARGCCGPRGGGAERSRSAHENAPPAGGAVFGLSTVVEVARQCSNLAPALTRAVSSHHAIRRRDSLVHQESLQQLPRRVTRLTETMLLEAARRYRGGEILRTIAKDLGVSRERLSSHLRERGVRLRREKPSPALVLEMCRRYEQGESLASVGARLGFNPSSVRVALLAAGVKLRDTHGRVR